MHEETKIFLNSLLVIVFVFLFSLGLYYLGNLSDPGEYFQIDDNYVILYQSNESAIIYEHIPIDKNRLRDSVDVINEIKRHIFPTIEKWEKINDYILVKQTPNEKLIHYFVAWEYQDIYDNEKSLVISDNILANDKHFKTVLLNPTNYWVIDSKQKKKYGPFNEKEFNVIADSLNVKFKYN